MLPFFECFPKVYSWNQHFRLYLSSKFGQKRPLIVKDRINMEESQDKALLSDSLITHCDSVKILSCKAPICNSEKSFPRKREDHQVPHSKCKDIDDLVRSLVLPGRVNKIIFDSDKNTVKYEITGNRHCRKKGSAHTRNNVYFKLFINKRELIQDCYSPSCDYKAACIIPISKLI